ncbi:MAG: hypothetical protein ACKOJH_03655 [Actinomycetota bacterium]
MGRLTTVVLVEVVDDDVDVVVVVVVAATAGARRQRRFLVFPAHIYDTPFTTRVAPTPAHFVPTISGW